MPVNNETTADRRAVVGLGSELRQKGFALEHAISEKNYRQAVKVVNTMQGNLNSLRGPLKRLIGTSFSFTWEGAYRQVRRRFGFGFIVGAILAGGLVYWIMQAR